MKSNERPTGRTGRPSSFRDLASILVLGLGYAIGFFATALVAGFVLESVRSKVIDSMLLLAIAPFSFLAIGVPLLVLGVSRTLRSRWEKKFTSAQVSGGYIASAGIVCGSVAGAGVGGLILLPSSEIARTAVPIVIFGSPLFAMWWLLRLKPRARDADYDDEMAVNPKPPGTIDLPKLAATESFGRRLGGLLFPNAVVALIGPLGAGKTQLSRAIAEGLGIANPAAVTSPTFTLIHEYPARLPIFHFDAYRLNGPNEFLDLGVTEYFEAGGVCLIEWADKVELALPAERLTIRIEVVDENQRRVHITAHGGAYAEVLSKIDHGLHG